MVANRELGIANSYTLEASFAGVGKDRLHFSVRDLQVTSSDLSARCHLNAGGRR